MQVKFPYGTWISPSGKVHVIAESCGHSRFLDYSDARKEGWIATVEGAPNDCKIARLFCIRYNRETVTKQALRTVLKRFKEHPHQPSLIAEGICCNPTYFGLGKEKTKREELSFLHGEIRNARNYSAA